jgi:DNA-binding NarL/FixJ family response regulator
VALVADGLANEQIATRFSVSPPTVKTHGVRAMTKVGARDRAQLLSFTFRAGLYRTS